MHRPAVGFRYLLDHLVGDAGVGSGAVHGAADIVDDHRRATASQIMG